MCYKCYIIVYVLQASYFSICVTYIASRVPQNNFVPLSQLILSEMFRESAYISYQMNLRQKELNLIISIKSFNKFSLSSVCQDIQRLYQASLFRNFFLWQKLFSMTETFFLYDKTFFTATEKYFCDRNLFLWHRLISVTETYFCDINLFLWQKLISLTEIFSVA